MWLCHRAFSSSECAASDPVYHKLSPLQLRPLVPVPLPLPFLFALLPDALPLLLPLARLLQLDPRRRGRELLRRALQRLLRGRELCPRRRQVSGGGYWGACFGSFRRASISAFSSAVITSHTD